MGGDDFNFQLRDVFKGYRQGLVEELTSEIGKGCSLEEVPQIVFSSNFQLAYGDSLSRLKK